MRRMILCGAICLSATILMAGSDVTPLNVKTGLWETTSTTTLKGGLGIPPDVEAQLTPEQRARYEAAMKTMGSGTPTTRTYKNCVTEKQRTENPFQDKGPDAKFKCQQTVVNSTGSDLELKEACTEGTSQADIHITLHASSSEHVTGTGTVAGTMGGRTMTSDMKMDSKWLGATCPAGLQ